jgi:tricorn protease-like protein
MFMAFKACILYKGQNEEARLMRFPTVGGNHIVFSYAGDLYSVSIDGGIAHRLTSDIGYETFAKNFARWNQNRLYRPVRRE